MPFCTMSSAAPTTWLTLALASKLCGSVFGLLSTAVTRAYLPPICAITFAYWFSAATATTAPLRTVAVGVAELGVQAAASMLTAAVAAATAAIRRRDIILQQNSADRGCPGPQRHLLIINENDNQYRLERQAEHIGTRPTRPTHQSHRRRVRPSGGIFSRRAG